MKQINTHRDHDIESVRTQFLTFLLGKDSFALDLAKTREVIEFSGVTEVPLMPEFVSGIINLRGEVVPVIDLAKRLGKPSLEIKKRTCVVIVEITHEEDVVTLGLLADAVCEVIEVEEGSIEPAPAFGARIRAEFIQGLVNVDDTFIILLNADKALSLKELARLVESEFK